VNKNILDERKNDIFDAVMTLELHHLSYWFCDPLTIFTAWNAIWRQKTNQPNSNVQTLLYTLNHSGWWSIFSASNATRLITPNAWF